MTLRNEIVDRERLDEITVKVIEADGYFNSAQSWNLTVEDTAGQTFEVKIWNTHDVNTWWREGWRYILKQGRGRRGGSNKVVLHSTDDFTVHRPDDVTDLLAISDSHLGREQRSRDDGAPHRAARQFLAAIGYANRYNVAAVLHAGDFFDDDLTPEDAAIAKSGFKILEQNDIPFYYIHGNHGIRLAEEFFTELNCENHHHLDTSGVQIDDNVEIFGVDHKSPSDFFTTSADFSISTNINHQVLILHQELAPVREHAEISLGTLSEPPNVEFDYVLGGHLHDPEFGSWHVTKVQYLGSTADLSKKKSAVDQSAWLLRATPELVDLNRLPLS